MKPTHKVSFYGARCYYDGRTGELEGINRFHDFLSIAAAHWHNFLVTLFPGYCEGGFPFRVLEEFDDA